MEWVGLGVWEGGGEGEDGGELSFGWIDGQ